MSGTTRSGFNADERARERESGPVVIGEVTYHPTRLTNKRLREVRKMSREAGKAARVAAEQSPEYKEALDEAKAEGIKGEEAKKVAMEAGLGSDEASDLNLGSLVDQLQILIRDNNMQPPTSEILKKHLDEDLDTREIDGLMQYLLGADPTPDSTKTETTTTS